MAAFPSLLRLGVACCLGEATPAFADVIIVDNAQPTNGAHQFSTDGSWITSTSARGCYGADFVGAIGPSATTVARFRPNITTAGIYKIYVRWPAPTAGVDRADRVPVEVTYHGGAQTENSRRLNQQLNGGVWVFLGSYYFAAGTDNFVLLRASDAGATVADAVRFELSDPGARPLPAGPLTTPRAEYSHTDSRLNPVETLIVRTDSGLDGAEPAYELRCAGTPFAVKGACGVEAIPELAAAGGNAVRSYGATESHLTDELLKRASDYGVRIMIGLAMAKPTGGFYHDAGKVAAQFAALSVQIDRWKNYAAVLAWGIGNEIDPVTLSAEDARPVYAAIEQLARYARDHDHYHPTVSVHAGSSPEKMRRIRAQAPSIDIVACNSYAHTNNVHANVIEAGWTGPYFVTEYSINQPMEQKGPAAVTSWGAVIEPLSGAKAARLLQIYREDLLVHPRCLGGFVFKGARGAFRVTHTWYPLFYDENGSLKPTPSLDAMRVAWGGPASPATTAPILESIAIDGLAPSADVTITGATGNMISTVTVKAPVGASLSYHVEVRPDVGIAVNTVPPPLAHLTITQEHEDPRKFAIRKADLAPGNYRLYYYARRLDASAPAGYVSVGTGNIPFRRL